MAARKSKKPVKKDEKLARSRLHEEIVAIILIAVGLFLIFDLVFKNAGAFGEAIAYFIKGVFGPIAYAFPAFLLLFGILLFARNIFARSLRTILLTSLLFLLLMLFISGFYIPSIKSPLVVGELYKAGAHGEGAGLIGSWTGYMISLAIGRVGLWLFSGALIIVTLLLLAGSTLSSRFRDLSERRLDKMERKQELRELREEEFDAQLERAEQIKQDMLATQEKNKDWDPPEITDEMKTKTPPMIFSTDDGPLDFTPEQNSTKKDRLIETVKNESPETLGTNASMGLDGAMAPGSYSSGDSIPGIGLEPNIGIKPGFGLEGYGDDSSELFGKETDDSEPDPKKKPDSDFLKNFDDREDEGLLTDGEDEEFSIDDVNTKKPSIIPGAPVGLTPGKGFKSGKNEDKIKEYRLPPIELLKKSPKPQRTDSASELKAKAARLEKTLNDFKVEARVVNVTIGPTVTRYEVQPNVGVKIQNIKSLEPDLALKLGVKSVRVVSMPDQAVISIEAYNARTELVGLRDIIDSEEFRSYDSKIAFALGKNISGEKIIADLAEMPHLLIAGTTGSGKSICLNSILLSILYRARPDEVKLILVDPKQVEFKFYNDVPHLLLPVVTEAERASIALGYAVSIMDDRYKKLAAAGVREIEGYNKLMRKEGRDEEVMPQIVIAIDELSDLMMIAPKQVQESISRLAAMARAAGMHLIVATQQPLASILTSVIKSNIPSRIALSVKSNSHSRVILDESGAERLHGNGDMLFSPVGVREPMRIQGSFMSDTEIHKVCNFVKKEMDPDYSQSLVDAVAGDIQPKFEEDEDDLFREALELIATGEKKTASVSMIQRSFRIGYNRAARLIDMMEERGIVASSDGTNKPRKIIKTSTQLAEMLSQYEDSPDSDNGSLFDISED